MLLDGGLDESELNVRSVSVRRRRRVGAGARWGGEVS